MKILVVGKGAPEHGGIPSFIAALLATDLHRTHELDFLNLSRQGTPQGGRATPSNLVRTIRDAAAVWSRAKCCDVVHVHTALAPTVTALRAGVLALAGRLRGGAVIIHAHGGRVELWLTGRLRRWLLRLAMRPAQRVIAVWSTGERLLGEALGDDRVVLVDNGVQVESYGPPEAPHSPPRVLFVGLLTARKGVVDLLTASQLLRDRGVEHEVWLLGGTPDEGPEAAAPVRAAAEGRATLLGTRPSEQMSAAYAAADVLCLASWWEAMPLSVLEAMASSLPVVATDVGDVARMVEHGLTGLVVPPRSPAALADALQTLLLDEDLRARMGTAGRERAERRFSMDHTRDALRSVYAELGGLGR